MTEVDELEQKLILSKKDNLNANLSYLRLKHSYEELDRYQKNKEAIKAKCSEVSEADLDKLYESSQENYGILIDQI